MSSRPNPPNTTPLLLVSANQAAELCGVARATWWKLHSSGRCPLPVRVGGRTLWRVTKLRAKSDPVEQEETNG